MISFTIPEEFAAYFKSLLEFQKTVRDEAVFKFMPDGIRVHSWDLSRVVYYSYWLPKSRLANYHVESQVRECFSTKEIQKILARMPDKPIHIAIDKTMTLNSGTKTFTVAPYALEEDWNQFPDDYQRKFASSFVMGASDFFEKVKDVQIASDILEIVSDDKERKVVFKNPDIAGLKTAEDYTTFEDSKYEGKSEKSYYSILAVLDGESLSSLAETFHVNFESDAPFIISFESKVNMKFVTVPRSL